MLDLGDTLVHEETVFPHVPEALDALRKFKTTDGAELALSLVSDFVMPDPPSTAKKMKDIFQQYVAILERLKLKKFFEPVERHITLSTHAGVSKPDRRVFELAIKRLGLTAKLSECLFITENRDHINACRQLKMATLQFGSSKSEGADFSDWSEAPLLINKIAAPKSLGNLEAALKLRLAAKHGLELISMSKKKGGGTIRSQAYSWQPVSDPKSGGKKKIEVPIPVEVDVHLDKKGRIRSVAGGQPDSDTVNEASAFLEGLEANKQVSSEPGPLPAGATHHIETDAKGLKRLVRKRFSATETGNCSVHVEGLTRGG